MGSNACSRLTSLVTKARTYIAQHRRRRGLRNHFNSHEQDSYVHTEYLLPILLWNPESASRWLMGTRLNLTDNQTTLKSKWLVVFFCVFFFAAHTNSAMAVSQSLSRPRVPRSGRGTTARPALTMSSHWGCPGTVCRASLPGLILLVCSLFSTHVLASPVLSPGRVSYISRKSQERAADQTYHAAMP